MGLFHCPMGSAFYDDEPCIDCGMCSATLSEEKVEASRKIRAYLRVHAGKKDVIHKIAVAGKGGVRKSTIVNLVANSLLARGYGVLVLDTDESNPGLFRLFGFDKEPKSLMTLLGGSSQGTPNPGAAWLARDQIGIDNIPEEFILRKNGLKFLMVGKIDDPFQGCACAIADLTRDLMEKLEVNENEVVVMDIEAGVESFGRGVERNMDTVLIVVEPSFESMAVAAKIAYMAEGMGIKRVGAILNKVTSAQVGQKMKVELDSKNVKCLGTVYLDRQVSKAAFEGRSPGNSKAMDDMKQIVGSLLDETKKNP